MARPHGLDDLKAQRAIQAIASGQSRHCAAGLIGVDVRTLHRWMVSDRQFCQRVKEADAKAEEKVVQALFALATDDERPHFEALKFWLKTRRAKTWREIQATPAEKQEADLSQVETEKLWTVVEGLRPKKATG